MSQRAIIAAVLTMVVLFVGGIAGIGMYRDHQAKQQRQERIDRMTEDAFCRQQQMFTYEECIGRE